MPSALLRRGKVPQKIYWEGNILNKISKKIVSLITMAAFVLTLVPAAAFADTNGTTIEASQPAVLTNNVTTTSVDLTVEIPDNYVAADGNLVLWFGDKANPENVAFTVANGGFTEGSGDWNKCVYIQSPTAGQSYTVSVALPAGVHELRYGYNAAIGGGNSLATISNEIGIAQEITVYTANEVVDVDDSRLLIDTKDSAASVDQNDPVDVEFNVVQPNGQDSDYALNLNNECVYIWLENAQGKVVDDATFGAVKDADGAPIGVANRVGSSNLWVLVDNATDLNAISIEDGATVETTLTDADDGYEIHAGLADNTIASDSDVTKINEIEPITVNVAAAAVKTDEIIFTDPGADVDVTGDNGEYTYTITDDVTPSGVKVYTVTGKAVLENGAAAQNEVLKVTAKRGVTLGGLSDEGTVTTNARGEFEFTFTISDNGEFDIVVAEANGDATSTLTVKADKIYVGGIETVEDGGYLLAGNETKYSTDNVGKADYFADAVQFAITDVNGNEVEGVTFNKDMYTLSVTAPEDSKLKAEELALVWDDVDGVYTLEYIGNEKAADLIPGEYTVKIAFKSSDTATTATFNLAKFGSVEDIVLDLIAGPADWMNSSSNNSISAIDDQVALGQSVEVVPYYVDANGIKVRADYADLAVGVNGEAVVDNSYGWFNDLLYFDTYPNTPANESLVGTTITIKVFDEENGKYVEKELTVVKNYLNETLSFDPTSGVVGEDNEVTVSVVDADGNVSKINGTLHAYVADQSNADAYVEVDVKNDAVKNGKGELTLYSDAEGTADVVVVVTAQNGELYGATLNYTFGAEDPNAENTVVMTIGSTDYVVNNDIIKGDAAPYVDSNWRTMVPFRVLGETFGAKVNWDQDAQTVTYTYGDTELVMTIGEETYTLNGEEQTMDTAPVLSGDRTYVPVRFVAEDLGYTVTALQDGETGLTASVVFQK